MLNPLYTLLLFALLACHRSLADDVDCGGLSKIPPGKDCVISRPPLDAASPGLLKIVGVQFFSKDSFKVKIGDKEEDVNCFGNCLLVLPPQTTAYELHVITSNETLGTRRIDAIQMIKPKVEIFAFEKFSIFIKANANFKEIEFTNPASDETSVLLHSESPGVTAQPLEANQPFAPISLETQAFLTDKKKFKLNFNTGGKEMAFNFDQWLVTKNCSFSVNLDDKVDKIELKTVDKNNVLSRAKHTCVYMVQASGGGNLELANVNLKEATNTDIVVKDGNKLSSSNLINSNGEEVAPYLVDLNNRITTGTGMLVILTTSFESGHYKQGSVTVKKSAFTKITGPSDKPLTITTDRLYLIEFGTGFPYLKFDKNFRLPQHNLTIYGRSLNEPILTYQQNEWIFEELWSGDQVLILNFTGTADAKPVTLNANLISKPAICSQLAHSPSSFILNATDSAIDQTCHFYIRPEATVYPVGLRVQNIGLGKDACLELRALSEGDVRRFSICSKEANIIRDHVPDFVLRSNDSYVLTYANKKTYPMDKILLQATFFYHAVSNVRIYNLTKTEPTVNVSSFDCPDNYPYYLDNGVAGIDQVTTDAGCLAVSFERYNLRTGDELSFIGEKLKFTAGRPDDFVHCAEKNENQSTLITSFITKFDALNNLLADEHAQGYKLAFERFACVLEYDQKAGIVKTPKYPERFTNATKCILVVDLAEKGKYLNLTVENGKENLDFGVLSVFDDASWQRQKLRKVFDQKLLKDNQTFSFNASSTKLVLFFDPLDKTTVNGFKLTIVKEKCDSISCDDGSRCVLPEIHCNWIAECLDGKDEINCSNPAPNPPPADHIIYVYRGLSGWVITFLIIPLAMLVGGVVHWKWPVIQARLRGSHSYREFSSFNSENA